MYAETKKRFEKTTGCKVKFDDWFIRISPSSRFTLHKPTLDKFARLSGQEGAELCALAKGLLDNLPREEWHGEIVSVCPELNWRYCLFFAPSEILVYDPELIGGKPFAVDHHLGINVGKGQVTIW